MSYTAKLYAASITLSLQLKALPDGEVCEVKVMADSQHFSYSPGTTQCCV
jgi:hypothetical protein